MTFREALQRHLEAIERRDLAALADTVADGALALVMADGKLVRTSTEFLELHRGWLAMDNWTLEAQPVEIFESASAATADG